MLAIGAILLLVGVLALAGGGLQRYRAGRIAKAPFHRTGEVRNATSHPKRAVSSQGRVLAPQLVRAPISGTQCLYYDYTVMAKWKVGDNSYSKRVDAGKSAAPFAIDDGSGPADVDASSGGDFEGLQTTFDKTQGRGFKNVATGAPIEFGDQGFAIPVGQKIDGVRIPENAKYSVVERCLMPTEHLYVNGRLGDGGEITTPAWASLMLSPKTREALLAGTASFAKKLLIGGGVASTAGAVLLVVAQVVSA